MAFSRLRVVSRATAQWRYLKCVDANDINKDLFKFKTLSGITGNVFTYETRAAVHRGSGIGGWAGIAWAAVSRRHRWPRCRGRLQGPAITPELGGSLTVFALPQ
jgi:hypothetical protein